jgi:hypothetical protein
VLVLGEDHLVFLGANATDSHLFSSTTKNHFEDYGALQSGWIRMGTTVPKVWSRFAMTRSTDTVGRVTGYLVTEDGKYLTRSGTSPALI